MFEKTVAAGKIKLEGDGKQLAELKGELDRFDPMFPVITP
jgi:alkyl sulfatase BDS1-like metallo-beta-lactamase superfamily hydrolase